MYIKNFTYVDENSDYDYKEIYLKNLSSKEIVSDNNYIFIPLDGHNLRHNSVMRSKYCLVNIDCSDWKNYFNFERNIKKENELFYDVLGVREDEEFIFLNRNFASPPDIFVKPINISTNYRIIEMKIIDNFTIFDWCKVLEKTKAIITVETSLNYIIEKLNLSTNNLQMFSKWNPANYNHIMGLFKKEWKYNYD